MLATKVEIIKEKLGLSQLFCAKMETGAPIGTPVLCCLVVAGHLLQGGAACKGAHADFGHIV